MGRGFQRLVVGVPAALAAFAFAPAGMAQDTAKPYPAGAPLVHGPVVTLPSWIAEPQVVRPPMPVARSIRGTGSIELGCTSQPTGQVTDCTVIYQDPRDSDLGLDRAVLAALETAVMSPRTRDGAPEASPVRFVVRFGSTPMPVTVTAPVGPAPEGEPGLIESTDWARAPRPDFPVRATAKGIANGLTTLNCGFLSTGELVDCQVVTETPTASGFAAAALASARRARIPDHDAMQAPLGSRIQFTLVFTGG